MRANRKGIAKKFAEIQNRDYKDIKFIYANKDDLMLTSYVVKKNSDKRNILKLSAMHDDVRCSRDERKNLNTICCYDKTKGCRHGNWQVHHQVQNQKVDNECLCVHARHCRTNKRTLFQGNQTCHLYF